MEIFFLTRMYAFNGILMWISQASPSKVVIEGAAVFGTSLLHSLIFVQPRKQSIAHTKIELDSCILRSLQKQLDSFKAVSEDSLTNTSPL